MSENSQNIRRAVRELGVYVGEMGEHQFVSRLLQMAAASGDSGISDSSLTKETLDALLKDSPIGPGSDLERLVSSIIGLSDGGTLLKDFIEDCRSFVTVSDASDITSGLIERIKGTEKRLWTVTSEVSRGENLEFCGDKLLSEIISDSNFNSKFDDPTKESPNIGVIQFHNAALNYANRSSGIVGLFLNLLPTIELSKCQPYVDMKVITKDPPTVMLSDGEDGRAESVGDGISLIRFLLGQTSVTEVGSAFLNAMPVGVELPKNFVKDENGNILTENGQPVMEEVPVTVAGMEIFTSPQTLVNADEPHYDVGPDRLTPTGRNASVIDRFRPFMTFKSFDVSVAPARGMISTKSAEVSLTLHDRSRLAEVSQIVSPGGLGDVEIYMEYGWSHPDGSYSNNAFATMLNSMRRKDKFQVVNSALSFNEVGEVDITLKLVSKGNKDLNFRMITDDQVVQSFDQIKGLFKEIRKLKKAIRSDLQDNEEMLGEEVLGKANSISAVRTMSPEDAAELNKLIKSLIKNPKASGEYKDLGNRLTSAMVAIKKMDKQIEASIRKKMDALKYGPDPFAKNCPGAGIYLINGRAASAPYRLYSDKKVDQLAASDAQAATDKAEEYANADKSTSAQQGDDSDEVDQIKTNVINQFSSSQKVRKDNTPDVDSLDGQSSLVPIIEDTTIPEDEVTVLDGIAGSEAAMTYAGRQQGRSTALGAAEEGTDWKEWNDSEFATDNGQGQARDGIPYNDSSLSILGFGKHATTNTQKATDTAKRLALQYFHMQLLRVHGNEVHGKYYGNPSKYESEMPPMHRMMWWDKYVSRRDNWQQYWIDRQEFQEKVQRMLTGGMTYAEMAGQHRGRAAIIHKNSSAKYASQYTRSKYTSFARIALEFIAKPLASIKKFNEVQLCFYPMNAYSTFARDDDTGSFPIKLRNFRKQLNERLKKNPQMTIAAFVGFMNENFFSNISSDIYGFKKLYERDEETGRAKLRKKYKDNKDNKSRLPDLKTQVFTSAYGPKAEHKFVKPQLQMVLEAVPLKGNEAKTILRVHFFDKACTSYQGFADLWESLRSGVTSLINTHSVSATSAKVHNPTEAPQASTDSGHSEQFAQQLGLLSQMDILEGIDPEGKTVPLESLFKEYDTASRTVTSQEEIDEAQSRQSASYVRIKGGPAGLRYLLHRNMPSIKYGSTYSAVLKANLATAQDNRMATIHMQRQNKNSNDGGPEGAVDDGLPMSTFPSNLSIETYGCPFLDFGQQYFIDFATGTTVDDVYAINGVSHKFTQGSFVTTVKFIPMMRFGRYTSTINNLNKLAKEINALTPSEE